MVSYSFALSLSVSANTHTPHTHTHTKSYTHIHTHTMPHQQPQDTHFHLEINHEGLSGINSPNPTSRVETGPGVDGDGGATGGRAPLPAIHFG